MEAGVSRTRGADDARAVEMKAECDFSKGERGTFYDPDAVFSFPIYLEPDASDFMSQLADQKEIDIQELVNEWLRANIRMIETLTAEELNQAA